MRFNTHLSKHIFRKGIATVVSAGMLLMNLSVAHAANIPSSLSASSIALHPDFIRIPGEFASLKEIHRGTNGKLIIHIQDAHANYNAQKNLAQTLKQMIADYQIPLVLVEGGDRDVTLNEVKKISDQKTWDIVANKLLFEGLITGAEYLNLTDDSDLRLLGLEYTDLYQENLRAYSDLSEKRDQNLKSIQKILKSLDILKNRVYPETLIRLDALKKKYSLNKSSFTEFFSFISEIDPFTGTENLPELKKLKLLQKIESGIDFNALKLEQEALFAHLTRAASTRDTKIFTEQISQMGKTPDSQTQIIAYLFELASQYKIPMDSLLNLRLYREYIKIFSEINPDRMSAELEFMEDDLFRRLLPDEDAKKIRAIDRYARLLEKAYSIQMSSEEFQMLKHNKPDFPTQDWSEFINAKLRQIGDEEWNIPPHAGFDDVYADLFKFYSLVSARDSGFMENTRRILNEENQNAAFLVCGGYHTGNLTKLLKEAGYSYIVLTPFVTETTDQKKYENILLQPVRNQKADRVSLPESLSAIVKKPMLTEPLYITAASKLAQNYIQPEIFINAVNESGKDRVPNRRPDGTVNRLTQFFDQFLSGFAASNQSQTSTTSASRLSAGENNLPRRVDYYLERLGHDDHARSANLSALRMLLVQRPNLLEPALDKILSRVMEVYPSIQSLEVQSQFMDFLVMYGLNHTDVEAFLSDLLNPNGDEYILRNALNKIYESVKNQKVKHISPKIWQIIKKHIMHPNFEVSTAALESLGLILQKSRPEDPNAIVFESRDAVLGDFNFIIKLNGILEIVNAWPYFGNDIDAIRETNTTNPGRYAKILPRLTDRAIIELWTNAVARVYIETNNDVLLSDDVIERVRKIDLGGDNVRLYLMQLMDFHFKHVHPSLSDSDMQNLATLISEKGEGIYSYLRGRFDESIGGKKIVFLANSTGGDFWYELSDQINSLIEYDGLTHIAFELPASILYEIDRLTESGIDIDEHYELPDDIQGYFHNNAVFLKFINFISDLRGRVDLIFYGPETVVPGALVIEDEIENTSLIKKITDPIAQNPKAKILAFGGIFTSAKISLFHFHRDGTLFNSVPYEVGNEIGHFYVETSHVFTDIHSDDELSILRPAANNLEDFQNRYPQVNFALKIQPPISKLYFDRELVPTTFDEAFDSVMYIKSSNGGNDDDREKWRRSPKSPTGQSLIPQLLPTAARLSSGDTDYLRRIDYYLSRLDHDDYARSRNLGSLEVAVDDLSSLPPELAAKILKRVTEVFPLIQSDKIRSQFLNFFITYGFDYPAAEAIIAEQLDPAADPYTLLKILQTLNQSVKNGTIRKISPEIFRRVVALVRTSLDISEAAVSLLNTFIEKSESSDTNQLDFESILDLLNDQELLDDLSTVLSLYQLWTVYGENTEALEENHPLFAGHYNSVIPMFTNPAIGELWVNAVTRFFVLTGNEVLAFDQDLERVEAIDSDDFQAQIRVQRLRNLHLSYLNPFLSQADMQALDLLISSQGEDIYTHLSRKFDDNSGDKKIIFVSGNSERGNFYSLSNVIEDLIDADGLTHIALYLPASILPEIEKLADGISEISDEVNRWLGNGVELNLFLEFFSKFRNQAEFIFYAPELGEYTHGDEIDTAATVKQITNVIDANPRAKILAFGHVILSAKNTLLHKDEGSAVFYSIPYEVGNEIGHFYISTSYVVDGESDLLAAQLLTQQINNLGSFFSLYPQVNFALDIQDPISKLHFFDELAPTNLDEAFDSIIYIQRPDDDDDDDDDDAPSVEPSTPPGITIDTPDTVNASRLSSGDTDPWERIDYYLARLGHDDTARGITLSHILETLDRHPETPGDVKQRIFDRLIEIYPDVKSIDVRSLIIGLLAQHDAENPSSQQLLLDNLLPSADPAILINAIRRLRWAFTFTKERKIFSDALYERVKLLVFHDNQQVSVLALDLLAGLLRRSEPGAQYPTDFPSRNALLSDYDFQDALKNLELALAIGGDTLDEASLILDTATLNALFAQGGDYSDFDFTGRPSSQYWHTAVAFLILALGVEDEYEENVFVFARQVLSGDRSAILRHRQYNLEFEESLRSQLPEAEFSGLNELISNESSSIYAHLSNLFNVRTGNKKAVFLADSTHMHSAAGLIPIIRELIEKDGLTHIALQIPENALPQAERLAKREISPEEFGYLWTGLGYDQDHDDPRIGISLQALFALLSEGVQFIFYGSSDGKEFDDELNYEANAHKISAVVEANPAAKVLAIGDRLTNAKQHLLTFDQIYYSSTPHAVGQEIGSSYVATALVINENTYPEPFILQADPDPNNLSRFFSRYPQLDFALDIQAPLSDLDFVAEIPGTTFEQAYDSIIYVNLPNPDDDNDDDDNPDSSLPDSPSGLELEIESSESVSAKGARLANFSILEFLGLTPDWIIRNQAPAERSAQALENALNQPAEDTETLIFSEQHILDLAAQLQQPHAEAGKGLVIGETVIEPLIQDKVLAGKSLQLLDYLNKKSGIRFISIDVEPETPLFISLQQLGFGAYLNNKRDGIRLDTLSALRASGERIASNGYHVAVEASALPARRKDARLHEILIGALKAVSPELPTAFVRKGLGAEYQNYWINSRKGILADAGKDYLSVGNRFALKVIQPLQKAVAGAQLMLKLLRSSA